MQSYPHRYTTWSVWRSECTCDIINTLSLSITASISYCLFTHYYYFLVTRILYVSSNLSISGICLFDKPFSTSFERSVLRSAQSSCCLRLLNEEGQCDSLQWMGGSSEDAAHEDGHCVLWVSFTPEARGRETRCSSDLCKYFSKQKEQRSSFTCIGNLPDPKEFWNGTILQRHSTIYFLICFPCVYGKCVFK